jgi:hypothetical protein
VAGDDYPVGSCEDWIDEAEFLDGGGDLRYLLVGVRPRIPSVGNEAIERPEFNVACH